MQIKFGEYVYDSPKYFFQHMKLKLKYRVKLLAFWLNFKRRNRVLGEYMAYRLEHHIDVGDIINRNHSYRQMKRLHKILFGEPVELRVLKRNDTAEYSEPEKEIKIEFYQGIRLRD